MEQFRNIEGYEGLYQVSNEGRVKSLNYRRSGEERVLKPAKNNWNYLQVYLSKNKKYKWYKVHRLVAQAFIPNPENLPEVNHLDEDKTNNNVENLEWCTREYNNNYGTRNERMAEAHRGKPNPRAAEKLRGIPKPKTAEALSIPVDMLTIESEFIRQFSSGKEAERWLRTNGFPKAANTCIFRCCKGKQSNAYGFKWQYSKQKELPN